MIAVPNIARRQFGPRGEVFVEGLAADAAWILENQHVEIYALYQGQAVLVDAERGIWIPYDRAPRRPGEPHKEAPDGWVDARMVDPASFEALPGEFDPPEGGERWPGWIPAEESEDDLKPLGEGLAWLKGSEFSLRPGTYTLIGPKLNGNPYHQRAHRLLPDCTERVHASRCRSLDDVKSLSYLTPAYGLCFVNAKLREWQRAVTLRSDWGWKWPLAIHELPEGLKAAAVR